MAASAPVGAVPDGRRRGPADPVAPVGWPTVLAVVLLVAGAAAITAGVRARRRHQARAAAVERAAQGYVEQVLALVWEDWIRAEASRGQHQLERWRDTHRL